MLFWKTIDIADNERALMYRRNRFEKVLNPGRHRIQEMSGEVSIDTFDITDLEFKDKHARFLMNTHTDKLSVYLEQYELTDKQVGLFYRNGNLHDVFAPGSYRAVWKCTEKVRMEVIDISEAFEIDNKLLGLLGRGVKIGQCKIANQAIAYVEVPDEHVGLLMVNGKFERLLQPSNYGYWKYNRSIVVKHLDLRLQSMDVSGQEILTKDRVSLRINLSASFRIVDPKNVALKLTDYSAFIYRELQLRLREAVGTQSLDALLEDKDSLNNDIADSVRAKLAEYGVALVSIGVKDIILPGEMKLILNQVVEAQKESEANLIRRREETQAMRSLHNTAKLMENNPVLLRLKELESLERVTERIGNISVYGGLDGVLNDLVTLGPKITGPRTSAS